MLKAKLLWKFLYWTLLLLLLSVFSAIYDEIWFGAFFLNLSRIPLMALSAWIIFDKIIPGKEVGPSVKVLSTILIIIIGAFSSRLLFGLFVYPFFYTSDYSFIFFNWERISSQLIIYLGGIGGYAIIRYFNERREWQKKTDKLQEEKRNAELSFLRAQIHPHFLFNTLNAIYSEALKKSEKTAEMILRLSDMLRAVLYDSENNIILLSKELKLIDDYINLEKMRFGKRLNFSFKKNLDPEKEVMIPPLSLFAFVENAFKHGTSENTDNAIIEIDLIQKNNFLEFRVSNSFSHKTEDKMGAKKGIGLSNVKRQLELIYGDRFELEQKLSDDSFLSILKLPIQ